MGDVDNPLITARHWMPSYVKIVAEPIRRVYDSAGGDV